MPNDQPASVRRRFSAASPLIRPLGLWEIVSGAIAFLSWGNLAVSMRRDSPGLTLIVIGGILFAILSIIGGIGLARRSSSGILLSMCVQALQVVGFTTGNLIYQLALGPYLAVTILWGHRVSLLLGYQPRLTLALNPLSAGPNGIAINLIACVLLGLVLAADPVSARSNSVAAATQE